MTEGLAIQAPVYGDEIRDRYAWLPAPFDQAVPRSLTEPGSDDLSCRTSLDERP